MKRLLGLLLILLLAAPALAWEVSDEIIDFAAEVTPGYCLVDATRHSNAAALLVKSDAGDCLLALCRKQEEEWTVTFSTTLPEECFATLTYVSEDTVVLNLYASFSWSTFSADTDRSFTIRLQEDGRWLIEAVRLDEVMLYFFEGVAMAEGRSSGTLYGDFLFSRDVTEVDWLAFPVTLEGAADQMALDDWAVTAQITQLFDGPLGESLALYQPGVPLRILEERDGYCRAAILGGETEGFPHGGAVHRP